MHGMDEDELGEYLEGLIDREEWKETYASEQSAEYEFKGTKLYVDGTKEDYELTSKKLVINLGFDEPTELKKVK